MRGLALEKPIYLVSLLYRFSGQTYSSAKVHPDELPFARQAMFMRMSRDFIICDRELHPQT
jgi:hypothetical protein